MLFARNSWLRWYGSAFLVLCILVFVAHEQGVWRSMRLSWQKSSLLSSSQNEVNAENDNTILRGIQTGKGSKMIVIGKIKKDDTTWVQRDLPE